MSTNSHFLMTFTLEQLKKVDPEMGGLNDLPQDDNDAIACARQYVFDFMNDKPYLFLISEWKDSVTWMNEELENFEKEKKDVNS